MGGMDIIIESPKTTATGIAFSKPPKTTEPSDTDKEDQTHGSSILIDPQK